MHSLSAVGFLCALSALSPGYADEAAAREKVKEAFAARGKEVQESYEAARQAVTDSSFGALETGTQHAALVLAYTAAYKAKDFDRAHEFASRASSLPEQDAHDWSYRLYSAERQTDGRDEAFCISSLVRLWGPRAEGLTPDSIRRAFRDTALSQLADARKEMLLALYDAGWRPTDESSASRLWMSLSLILLDGNEVAKAMQAVALVDEPIDLIAMHADSRYKRLLKAPYFESDPHTAARLKIKMLRIRVVQQPRSLRALVSLTQNLLTSREDQEALDIAAQADRRIVDAPTAPPFDEVKRYHPWILNAKASALRHLGRFGEAETELRRALGLAAQNDAVNHQINLAALLCELNRPDEALHLLPTMDQASDYGKTQIAMVELIAASEQADAPALQQHMDYLRDHQQISPDTYERALLVAGEFDKAQELLISRLADPATRTDALVRVQIYAEKKLPPNAQTWQLAHERLRTAPNVLKAVSLVGSVSRYAWRYD